LNIITTKNLCFRYKENSELILNNINLEIEEGDFVTVLGHNGSGKSTFAKLLNAILSPTSGSIEVAGYDVTDESKLMDIRKSVGLVFQNPDNQIIATVVEEDVAFSLENIGIEPDEMRKRVDEALKAVNMFDFMHHATHQLSGGQKQRIAIAGVIAMRPKILVLDEPTAMLDPQGRNEVLSVIKNLNAAGITVILITHFMNEAAMSRRVIVMNEGEILIDGTPYYVFQNAGLLRSIGLDVPQSTELMFKLRKEGYRVPLAVLTEAECTEVLINLLSGRIGTE
jgi:energy-coupling factor transport system ATP-binding protein